ncbi:hypothetical protein D3C78_1537030 [compost metagenome]
MELSALTNLTLKFPRLPPPPLTTIEPVPVPGSSFQSKYVPCCPIPLYILLSTESAPLILPPLLPSTVDKRGSLPCVTVPDVEPYDIPSAVLAPAALFAPVPPLVIASGVPSVREPEIFTLVPDIVKFPPDV